jgi:hypothetical protein
MHSQEILRTAIQLGPSIGIRMAEAKLSREIKTEIRNESTVFLIGIDKTDLNPQN